MRGFWLEDCARGPPAPQLWYWNHLDPSSSHELVPYVPSDFCSLEGDDKEVGFGFFFFFFSFCTTMLTQQSLKHISCFQEDSPHFTWRLRTCSLTVSSDLAVSSLSPLALTLLSKVWAFPQAGPGASCPFSPCSLSSSWLAPLVVPPLLRQVLPGLLLD